LKDNSKAPTENNEQGKKNELPNWAISFAFAVMVLFFGVRFVAIPVSNQGLEPFWGSALRLAIAAAILLVVAFARKSAFPSARGMFFSVIYGFFSIGLNIGLLYWGLLHVNSDIASIVYAAVPLVVVVLSVGFGLETFKLRLLTGAFFGLWGVEVIFGVAMGYGANIYSLLAIIAGAIFNAVGMIAAKKAQDVDSILMNGMGFALGASMLFFMSLLTGESIALPGQEVTWLAVSFLVAVSVIGYTINVLIIQKRSVSYASFSNVLTPLVTILAGSFMFAEEVTPAFIIGSGLIFTGLFFSGHIMFKKSPA